MFATRAMDGVMWEPPACGGRPAEASLAEASSDDSRTHPSGWTCGGGRARASSRSRARAREEVGCIVVRRENVLISMRVGRRSPPRREATRHPRTELSSDDGRQATDGS